MSMNRKPISSRVRFDVFKRDDFTCVYCGGHPPLAVLECDHMKPVAKGGTNDPANLVTACDRCNRGKGAIPLSVVPPSLAEQAAAVAEREAQLRGYAEVMEAKRQRLEGDAWRVLEVLNPHQPPTVPMDQYRSVCRFIERLGVHEVLDAAEATMAKRIFSDGGRFRYFCGVCWNKARAAEGGE